MRFLPVTCAGQGWGVRSGIDIRNHQMLYFIVTDSVLSILLQSILYLTPCTSQCVYFAYCTNCSPPAGGLLKIQHDGRVMPLRTLLTSAEVLSPLRAYDSMEKLFRRPMLTRLQSDFASAVKILLTPRSAKYRTCNKSDSDRWICTLY
jgi:hypothetical protein